MQAYVIPQRSEDQNIENELEWLWTVIPWYSVLLEVIRINFHVKKKKPLNIYMSETKSSVNLNLTIWLFVDE